MLIGTAELRTEHREAIVVFAKEGLAAASDAKETRGLLDVAFRAVFYVSHVVPQEGANEIIDLFMQYVGHADPSVHEFARQRLRHMGFVWRFRYEEILQFLIKNAPELREVLTAKPLPGIAVDVLLGGDDRVDLYTRRSGARWTRRNRLGWVASWKTRSWTSAPKMGVRGKLSRSSS